MLLTIALCTVLLLFCTIGVLYYLILSNPVVDVDPYADLPSNVSRKDVNRLIDVMSRIDITHFINEGNEMKLGASCKLTPHQVIQMLISKDITDEDIDEVIKPSPRLSSIAKILIAVDDLYPKISGYLKKNEDANIYAALTFKERAKLFDLIKFTWAITGVSLQSSKDSVLDIPNAYNKLFNDWKILYTNTPANIYAARISTDTDRAYLDKSTVEMISRCRQLIAKGGVCSNDNIESIHRILSFYYKGNTAHLLRPSQDYLDQKYAPAFGMFIDGLKLSDAFTNNDCAKRGTVALSSDPDRRQYYNEEKIQLLEDSVRITPTPTALYSSSKKKVLYSASSPSQLSANANKNSQYKRYYIVQTPQ